MAAAGPTRAQPGRAVKLIAASNLLVYLVELGWAYAVNFDPDRVGLISHVFGLSSQGLLRGWVWQLVTHLWVHDPDKIFHIVFNLLVLWWFGNDLEQRWGTRRFFERYLLFGAGSAVAIVLTSFLWPVLFDSARPPTVGASGAIAGLVCAYCLIHWKSRLRLLIFDLSGRGLLILFIVLDVFRLVLGEPIAVEGHWGGMATAALLMRTDVLSPRLLWLRFKRWRLRRRLRIEPGGKPGSNGDSRYLH